MVTARATFRYESMDHFRAIAVLWVLAFHGFTQTFGKPAHPVVDAVRTLAAPGWMGVHLFFVVSGYCIAASARSVFDTGRGPWDFVRDRLLRIFPVYWAALAISIAVSVAVAPLNGTRIVDNLPHGPLGWLGNLTLLQPYVGIEYYSVVYWSLVVELGFYAVVAVLLAVAGRTSLRVASTVGLGLGVVMVAVERDASAFPGFLVYWPEFVCGVAAFVAIHAWREGRRPEVAAMLALIVAFGIAGFVLPHPDDYVLTFAAACALALVFAAPFDVQIARFRPLRWMGWVGGISYSLYLLHLTFESRVLNLAMRRIAPSSVAFLVVEAVAVAVAIGAAYLFSLRVEEPLNAWRKRVARKRAPSASVAV